MENRLWPPCSRKSRKKGKRLLSPSAKPDIDIKGGCFKTVALKCGMYKIVFC